jgi:hypothetical protein
VIAMPRIMWLALVCLLFLSALFALRTSTGARTIVGSTEASFPSAIDDWPPLAKFDRLPSLDLNRAEAKAPVTTVRIAPMQQEAKASPKTSDAYGVSSGRKEGNELALACRLQYNERTTVLGQPKSERER